MEWTKDPTPVNRSILKELLDRIGYGLGSWQYVNIIFFAIGSPLYIIAAFNGTRVFFTGLFSSYAKTFDSTSRGIMLSGCLLAISFFVLGYAAYAKILRLFFAAAIVGGCAAVVYAEQYQTVFRSIVEKLRKPRIASQVAAYGTIITLTAMFFAAVFLDRKILSYSMMLTLAGVAFLMATFAVGRIAKTEHEPHRSVLKMVADQWREYKKSSLLVVILFCSSLSGMVNTFGNAFYGIFIFKYMTLTGFGGFTNVAVIFMVGLLAVLIAPSITRLNAVRYGKFPMLVFGTLLMAILPLSYYYKPNLLSIALGTIIGIVGAAIVGTSQGLVIMDTLRDEDRKKFFRFNSTVSVLPYIIFVPLVSWLVHTVDMRLLFFMLSLTLAAVVAPLYFVVVALHYKERV
ncbi:MAG: MFS transporter [Candidatus Woesearchaeota archaeon]